MLNAKPKVVKMALFPNRVEALTDGVFAIVMTILVLELGVPIVTGKPLYTELTVSLLTMWPKFVSYFVTFLMLGYIWSIHYYQFAIIRRSDSVLVWTNIIFLMFMSLLPFSTSILGQHIDEPVSVLIYGGNLAACMLVRYLQWSYATNNHRLVERNINPHSIKQTTILMLICIGVFIIGMVLSFLSTIASICVFTAIIVFLTIRTTLYLRIGASAQPVKMKTGKRKESS